MHKLSAVKFRKSITQFAAGQLIFRSLIIILVSKQNNGFGQPENFSSTSCNVQAVFFSISRLALKLNQFIIHSVKESFTTGIKAAEA
jgi:hypothetical protein